jgi:hypothetical protein
MSAAFNEKKLELEYYHLWLQQFSSKSKYRNMEVYCPGQDEVHVGFDLGFAVQTSPQRFTSDDFFDWIKGRVGNSSSDSTAFLAACFYQYKLLLEVPDLTKIRDKTLSADLLDRCAYPADVPVYRAKLDTIPKVFAKGKKVRPYSQHEALCRLATVPKASVAYCTPSFTRKDGFPKSKSLSDLILTSVDSTTPKLDDGKPHYLYLTDKVGTRRHWCSEPFEAVALRADEINLTMMTPTELFRLIKFNAYAFDERVDQGASGDLAASYEETRIEGRDLEREVFLSYMEALPALTRIIAFW